MPKKHSPSTISLYFFLLNIIPSQQPKTTFATLQVLYMPLLYFLFTLPHSSTPLFAPPTSLLPRMVLFIPNNPWATTTTSFASHSYHHLLFLCILPWDRFEGLILHEWTITPHLLVDDVFSPSPSSPIPHTILLPPAKTCDYEKFTRS